MNNKFQEINSQGYLRINKRKARNFFVKGYVIHVIPHNAGFCTHHLKVHKSKIPSFDSYITAYKDCYCCMGYPEYYIRPDEVLPL